ncbi:ABC transporter permease [Herbidospora daliensis]|uniref:ABC transporter permease n=1 Tax=Herbidospora daliensis TaxID=295585 RepID=UPI000781ABE7|nr:ABC transporter permease [Herbidospora daliensis]
MRAVTAELAKLATLPSVWLATLLALVVPTGIALLNRGVPGPDRGYQELAFGVMGVIVLGVVAVSSEYLAEGADAGGGRQLTTSLTAVPSRLRFLAAKALAVVLVAVPLAFAATAVTMAVVQVRLDLGRLAGVVCYWTYTALLAFAITVLLRHGIVPLTVLLVNTSVVSVTYLLTKVTPLANYFPDMAGVRMFVGKVATDVVITPLVGLLVMSAWVAGLLAVAGAVFVRRDA